MAGMIALATTALWVSPSGAFTLDFLTGKHAARQHAPVVLAQANDAELQVQQLQEQIRQLNGKIEDMSYQILQMQEQLRKAQEDNEFRFQQLEGGKKKSSNETVPANQTEDTANASGETTPGANQTNDAAALDQPLDNSGDSLGTQQDTGTPPVDLGQLKFDQSGKVVGADQDNANSVQESALPPPDTSTENQTASLGKDKSDPDYQTAYEQILSGDYVSAENSFTTYIQAHPDSKRIADANFWLGEAQYSQGKFNDAAKTFLDGYKAYGKSAKAPEMLLKLAMSLAKLDSKDTACATLRQVSKAYPKASRAIITKVASEQKRLAC